MLSSSLYYRANISINVFLGGHSLGLAIILIKFKRALWGQCIQTVKSIECVCRASTSDLSPEKLSSATAMPQRSHSHSRISSVRSSGRLPLTNEFSIRRCQNYVSNGLLGLNLNSVPYASVSFSILLTFLRSLTTLPNPKGVPKLPPNNHRHL
jgi:hypothetical protein